ncbi:hypothetical protein WH96_16265 [Kiloniella spongiae]|uniref:MEKHLA domain-containing protein n=1 Tax=Kiloniella spongiae TaxID=1489064 RepID=A0A0H2MSV2_9PROT|nr:hypothetical protein WH96_16265 [Kiloniella spongiae]
MISEFQEQHAKRLIESFMAVTGKDLITSHEGVREQDTPKINIPKKNIPEKNIFAKSKSVGQQLFEAPFVVVSHNGGDDPILNYGNLAALDLWEMRWEDFTRTPSRKTAEPEFRDDRAVMLKQAKEKGYFDNYTGIRISRSGKRFLIKKAIIWTVPPVIGSKDLDAQKNGQAATFSSWAYLDE